MTWTKDIVVKLEAAVEDVDVLSTARVEMLLREAARAIRALRANGSATDEADLSGIA